MLGASVSAQDALPQSTAAPSSAPSSGPGDPGLLFYLSGDHGFNANYAAGGNAAPNYLSDVQILPGDVPAPLPAPNTTIRKVQINDAFDIGRWWCRATDGIRETTWPGVYNRSRLTGRTWTTSSASPTSKVEA
jgi:hypothetical protein